MDPKNLPSTIAAIRTKIKDISDFVPIGIQQQQSGRAAPDSSIKDPVDIATIKFGEPEEQDAKDLLFKAIQVLGDDSQEQKKDVQRERERCGFAHLEGELVIPRKPASGDKGQAALRKMHGEEAVEKLAAVKGNGKVVMFIHGGNF